MQDTSIRKRIVSDIFPSDPLSPFMQDTWLHLCQMQERHIRSELRRLRIPRMHAEIHVTNWRIERIDDEIRAACEIVVKPTVIGPRPLPD